MADFRVGIVGCGGIAREHAAAYREVGGTVIAGVCDVNPKAAEAFAAETGAKAFPTVEAMLAAVKPEAASVCTPPGTHLAACRPLLAAKVAVLCEKPMEATEEAARILRDVAAAAGVPFQVAYCHRFHPAILGLKRLIDAGTLGRPLLFRNIFAGALTLAGNHRVDPALAGGGCIADNGSHGIDLFRFLVGDVAAVSAEVANLVQMVPVEDLGLVHLTGPGGVRGELTLSFSLPVAGNWVEWYGTEGTGVVSYWNDGAPDLAFRTKGGDAWIPVDVSAAPERFAGEIGHFLACVREGRPPRVSADDGLATARVVAAAYRSAREGRRIAL